jgi:hypothetical protein
LRTITLRFLAFFSFFSLLLPVCAIAQSAPSAYVERHSIYIGGEYALVNSDYFGGNKSLNQNAFSIYGDYYFSNGAWPIALDVNYTKAVYNSGYQKREFYSFISSIKVSRRFGRLEPFGKFGAGIGHISQYQMISYHQYGQHFAIGMGGGLDYRLTKHIMLRPVDFTSERWNFYPNALSPYMLGFGFSYRIH